MKSRPDVQPINARAETIAEKRMFSDAYAKRRCIVPMMVFYERDHGRRLHAFALKEGGPFGVAGIWENWLNPEDRWKRTFCIITVAANDLVAAVPTACPPSSPSSTITAGLGPSQIQAIYCDHFLLNSQRRFRCDKWDPHLICRARKRRACCCYW
jgi:hypothetical protein